MAVIKKEELLEAIRNAIGDVTSDVSIKLLEDLSDTIDAKEVKVDTKEVDEWKQKYDELDKSWREKYTQRFFGQATVEPVAEPEPEPESENIGFDDLFE